MSVKQIIKYKSDNSYFAGFIQAIIDDSEISANVSQSNNGITLLLDNEDESKLNIFNEKINRYLPYSIFLGDIQTQSSDDIIEKSDFRSASYNIAPCAKCLEALNDPSSEYYLDESLKCDHYGNEADIEFTDYTIFSPHYVSGCSVLVTDAEKVNDLFILTDDELQTLFSIEKPTIKATIKDETLKKLTGKKFINLKAPYNNRSALAAINAKESEVDYLFFQDNDDLKVVVVQKNKTIIKASRVASQLENFHDDSSLNRFLNISKEAGFTKGAIGVNLSTSGISFIVSNELGVKKVIEFQSFDLAELLERFKNDEKRSKLLDNFSSKYPAIIEKLQSGSKNIYETICAILELKEESFESLCDKSYEFRGNGGLKIDMNFNDDGFSYDDCIGSIISFKLAGVDEHYLAYSIFEAFGDMSIATLNQLKTKFKIDNFIMMGDMFGNSVLYSRILSKFQLNNPYFSSSFALDD